MPHIFEGLVVAKEKVRLKNGTLLQIKTTTHIGGIIQIGYDYTRMTAFEIQHTSIEQGWSNLELGRYNELPFFFFLPDL